MEDYEYIDRDEEKILKNQIEEKYIKVEKQELKYDALKNVLYKLKPETTIIFTNTKKQGQVLYEDMKSEGF